MPINNTQISGGQFPDGLDPHNVPPELKKEGSDWFAVFSPKVKRVLDVSLMHTLMHESVVCCVRFSADGKYLATGCNRTAQIYDVKTGVKTCVLADESARKAGDLYIRSVCFSPDGKFLATAAEDKQIRIWDIKKKRIRYVFDGHQQVIYSLDFSLDGRLIVSGSDDATVRVWDMVDGSSRVLTTYDADSVNRDAGIASVAISPNDQLVAAACLDCIVRIWDVATGMLIERLRGHTDMVYSVAFTPDGKGLISGSLDKTLKYWDISSLVASKNLAANTQCTMNFLGHTDYVLSVAASHDGRWIVSGSKDRGVRFWDSHTGAMQCMLQGHKNSVIDLDLSPAGGILATGSGDWQARIWRYANMEEVVLSDMITCLWDDCGIVLSPLPSLIEHIHSSAFKPIYLVRLLLPLGDMQPPRPRTGLAVRAHLPHSLTYWREAVYMLPASVSRPTQILADCDKSFTRSNALAKHMRLQHMPSPPRKRKRPLYPAQPNPPAPEQSASNILELEPQTPSELDNGIGGEGDFFSAITRVEEDNEDMECPSSRELHQP
ncbi:hypothetical protein AZE42_07432 [Rhizopogon vesiculosus]|uniref:C2H2-type domain-containing protein n=1 Tax=Rhizopogon vesiculosus TaxID=180088 RepID=A0A1J8PGI6_9AGAM|nr:hypothetical protein AZE42_07432 [Rhizopogon vesiculosus]